MSLTRTQNIPKREPEVRKWKRQVNPQVLINAASTWSVFTWMALSSVTASILMAVFYKLSLSLSILCVCLVLNAGFYELFKSKIIKESKKQNHD